MANYEVIVGNIGTVYTGTNPVEARRVYGIYKKQSMSNVGRAGGEGVTIFTDGEPTTDYVPTRAFTIREGDGNNGCYRRGVVQALDAYDALKKASRRGLISKPRDVVLSRDIEGDDQFAVVCSYVQPIWGDVCRWVAEAHLADNE